MMFTETESVRSALTLAAVLTLLAAGVNAVALLNVAELQSAATIVVRSQAPESEVVPAFDIGLLAIAAGAFAPFGVLALAMARRWPFVFFLGSLLAVILVIMFAAGAVAFATYRYWRDHQAVASHSQTMAREFVLL